MKKSEVLNTIDSLRAAYDSLWKSAMEGDDEIKVAKFNQACITLDILKMNLGLEKEEEIDEDQHIDYSDPYGYCSPERER